jgi:hypothetical protein
MDVNPVLFGLFCILIIFNVIVISLYTITRAESFQNRDYPVDWCFGDWLCGTPQTAITSPVLEYIPIMYACRGDNVTTTDVSGTTTPCVCPIQFERDYDLDTTSGSSTFGKVIKVDTPATPGLYVCDNGALANPVDPVDTDPDYQGFLAICDVSACSTLWATSNFTTKAAGFGKPVAVSASAVWPIKGGGTRSVPAGWNSLTGVNIPQYTSGTLYKQLTPPPTLL